MSNKSIPVISLSDFDYHLPKEKIALYPLADREKSKLLFADTERGIINDKKFADLNILIEDNALIIINETKVIGARLHFYKPTGGKVEVLLVEPIEPSPIPAITLATTKTCTWECIIGGRNIVEGMELTFASDKVDMKAKIISRNSNKAVIEFNWQNDITFSRILEIAGETPLPPYIDRDEDVRDSERYQTVYAHNQGSVAAPTAGLHFTDELIGNLESRGIEFAKITLHIGPGTFQPIETDDIKHHEMHHEQIFIYKNSIEQIRKALIDKRRIIAVGTTCMRTIESLYWLGCDLSRNEINLRNISIEQWRPYMDYKNMDLIQSLDNILSKMKETGVEEISGKTQLLIIPGYQFKIINGLITNFHMPKSTLILLVAAFSGFRVWIKIYNHALNNGYRFLSFGDSSYLIKSIT